MTKFVGRRGVLGVGKESSRGTPVNPDEWIPRVTISFDDRTTTAREEEGLGRIEDSDSNHVVSKMGEGDIEFEANDRQLGMFLTSIMGASPSTSGGPTYTHDYSVSNTNQPQSLSLFYEDPDEIKLFPLSVVSQLSITVEQDAIVRCTATIMSKVGRDWTTQTADFTEIGQKFLHQHLVFKLATDTSGLSAASAISLKSATLNINRNATFDNVLGTVEPEDVLGQQLSVDGSITLNKEDDTYRDYMKNGTYRALQFALVRSATSSLTIQLPKVDFTEWEQDRALNEIVGQSINFKGNYDAANAVASISTCSLVNTYDGTNY